MTRLALLGPVVEDRRSELSAQRRLNMYLDILPGDGDKSVVVARGTPGLRAFSSIFTGDTVTGLYWWDQSRAFLAATDTKLYSVAVGGSRTLCGTYSALGTVESAIMADNGAAVMVALPTGVPMQKWDGTTLSESTFSTEYPGVFPLSVAYVGSRWVANDSTKFYWSGLTTTTAEDWDQGSPGVGGAAVPATNPDRVARVCEFNGNLVVFGTSSVETWGVTADADSPYALIVGTGNGVGLYARYSLARASDSLIFIGRSKKGGVGVYRMDGYQPTPVSPSNLEYKWRQFTHKTAARCFAYRQDGHEFYHVSFPTGTDANYPSWLYDLTADMWSEVSSGGAAHKAFHGEFMGDSVGSGSTTRTKTIVSDPTAGTLYELDPTYYSDNGSAIARQVVLPHLYDANSLNMMGVSRFRLDKAAAGVSPTLTISRDGGQNYGTAMSGSENEDGTLMQWNALGRSRDFLLKLDASGTEGPVLWTAAYAETMGGTK